MTEHAISVSELTKIFPPNNKAVDNVSLEVKQGEIFALLGPNGAGKSTTIRILSTLCGFDSGQALVDGIDVDRHPNQVRSTIGVVAQKTGVDYFLTGRENIMLQGFLYHMSKADVTQRVSELSSYFELDKSLDNLVSTYSGGMTRKLDIAMALIHRPKILFLDEPTLGLDIHSRKILWTHIRELNEKFGLTILLTTHYLEEADSLSHRVGIINDGKMQVIDTADALKNGIKGDSIGLSFDGITKDVQAFVFDLMQQGHVKDSVWDDNTIHLYVDNGAESVPIIMNFASKSDIHITTLSLARPTLDDVFLKYTGSSIEGKKDDEAEPWWKQWEGKGGGGKWAKQWQDSEETDATDTAEETGAANGQAPAPATATETEKTDTASTGSDEWQGNEWTQGGDQASTDEWQGNEWTQGNNANEKEQDKK